MLACGVVFPTSLLTAGPQADASDAPLVFPDAGSPDVEASACPSPLPPPPSESTAPGQLTVISALRTIAFTESDGGPTLGYNLDCVDTCPGPGSCVATQPNERNCDADGGRDLAGNSFFNDLEVFASASGYGSINTNIEAGRFALLLQVTDYSGEKDDSDVSLGFFVSNGLVPPEDGGATPTPQWDGTDVWTVDPRTAGGVSHDEDGGYTYFPTVPVPAYVTDYTLVGTVPNLELSFGGSLLTLSNASIVAKIIPALSTGGYDLEGQVVARVSVGGILALLGSVKDPADPTMTQYLCGDDLTYLAFKKVVCGEADIMSDPAKDNTGASCDALSIAIGFTAFPANFGPEVGGKPVFAGCDGGVAACTP